MEREFEILPHTADLKIRVYGKDLPMLFCNALKGMFLAIEPVAPGCHYVDNRLVCEKLDVERLITVESSDLPSLLVDYLSEALYLADVHNEAYLDATITEITSTKGIKPTWRVSAVLKGVKITDFLRGEIKAVTHHRLLVERRTEVIGGRDYQGWVAEIVFDL